MTASERIRSLITEVKRLSHEEMARVQALAGADEWFLEGDGHPVGPLSTAQMKERWLAHGLRPESRCWGVGLPGWTPLCRITSLARALGLQPLYPIRTARPPPPPPEALAPPPVAEPKVESKDVLPELAAPPSGPARPAAVAAQEPTTPVPETASLGAKVEARREAASMQSLSVTWSRHTRPTRPRPVLVVRKKLAAAPEPERPSRKRPASSHDPQYGIVPLPAPTHLGRPRSPFHTERMVPPAPELVPARLIARDEPVVAPPGARSGPPRWSSDDLSSEEPPISPAAHRALRAVVGAGIGLSAAILLVALMTLPPLLSPPKPKTPPSVAAVTPAPATAPTPAPAPGAARPSAPERPAKKSASPEPDSTRDPVLAHDPVRDPAPVPTADPATEAAFDRTFGSPGARPASKSAEHSNYIPPTPPPQPRARLTDADVMAVVTAHKAQVVKCRNEARAKDPELAGRLLMRWDVSLEGDAKDVEALPGDLQDTDLAACVAKAIRSWRFPRHTAEQPPITFPFVF
ncbi:MAG TPA: AgmX/PglI C-terminal domain-containing protein [Myxococcaceae bacterium]